MGVYVSLNSYCLLVKALNELSTGRKEGGLGPIGVLGANTHEMPLYIVNTCTEYVCIRMISIWRFFFSCGK